ncbi:I66 family serine proteinase inhibitor [Nostoc sp. DSM 114159]|jgi:hypothetical protein
MSISNGNYILNTGGANTSAIESKVYAVLLEEPPVEKWLITSIPASGDDVVIIQTNDGSKAWAAPSQVEAQVTVEPLNPNSPAPNQLFRIVPEDPDEEGQYFIQSKSSDNIIGRYPIEDRSLMPKRIVLIPQGLQTSPWIIKKA